MSALAGGIIGFILGVLITILFLSLCFISKDSQENDRKDAE